MVCRKDHDALILVFKLQHVNFNNYVETVVTFETAKVAEAVLKPCSIQKETVSNAMPIRKDQVRNIRLFVSNTSDLVNFAITLINNAAASMMKMVIGSTTVEPRNEVDNLWGDKP